MRHPCFADCWKLGHTQQRLHDGTDIIAAQDAAQVASSTPPLLSLPVGMRGASRAHDSSAGPQPTSTTAASSAQLQSPGTSARGSPQFDSDQENKAAEPSSLPPQGSGDARRCALLHALQQLPLL
jgi:hypothetical protein